MPAKYVEGSVALGPWLGMLRTWERSGAHRKYLTPERKRQLEAIGMVWDRLDRLWERNYGAAVRYYEKWGNLDVPSDYVDADGIRLGAWISRMRRLRHGRCRGTPLTAEQTTRLDAIGMVWRKRTETAWERGFLAAEVYAKKNRNLLVPASYVSDDGVKLGAWIQRRRVYYKENSLAADRVRRLEAIGMVWDTHSWMRRLTLVRQYCREHGTANIPQNCVMEGCWVGKWLAVQRRLRAEGKLTGEQDTLISELEAETTS